MKTDMVSLVQAVSERIEAAARRAGRDPAEVTLMAVTKTHSVETIAQAVEAGITHLGENRVQEASQKIPAILDSYPHVRWHLIGHLQRNKAGSASQLFDMLHALDSVRLAETLQRQVAKEAGAGGKEQFSVLLQVNVSGEASKEGFDLSGGLENREQLPQFLADVERVLSLPNLRVQGLMTIAPFSADPETARPVFQRLRLLRDALAQQFPQADWRHLSMGMTGDFEVAIEEGSTFVRVGRAIFGERPR
jgi:hypothetical protein